MQLRCFAVTNLMVHVAWSRASRLTAYCHYRYMETCSLFETVLEAETLAPSILQVIARFETLPQCH